MRNGTHRIGPDTAAFQVRAARSRSREIGTWRENRNRHIPCGDRCASRLGQLGVNDRTTTLDGTGESSAKCFERNGTLIRVWVEVYGLDVEIFGEENVRRTREMVGIG